MNMLDYSLKSALEWLINTNVTDNYSKKGVRYCLYDDNGDYPALIKYGCNFCIYLEFSDLNKNCNIPISYDIYNDIVFVDTSTKRRKYELDKLQSIYETDETYFQHSVLDFIPMSREEIGFLIQIMKKLPENDLPVLI